MSLRTSVARLAIVLSHPTQYYSPWFQWLASNTGIDFKVFYLWDFGVTKKRDPHFGQTFEWDLDLLSGYGSEILENTAKNPGADHFFGFRNPQLFARLRAFSPNVVLIFGYKWMSHLRVVYWCRLSGIPILLRGDSHLIGRQRPKAHVRILLSLLFKQFAGFTFVGLANREYYEKFGVPASKLTFAPHSVNEAHFDRSLPSYAEEAGRLRRELGVPDDTRIVLFAGKFVARKQPFELLQAFLGTGRSDWALVFVGDGVELPRVKREAEDRTRGQDGPMVKFLPFANQVAMPARYLMADVFALPSYDESWGLAVNEAMHMGVPCLVSDHVGCQKDLVIDGETGWVFKLGGPGELQSALSRAFEQIASPSSRDRLRQAAISRVSRYTYGETTRGLVEALSHLGLRAEK